MGTENQDFYTLLSSSYDEIFPVDPEQLAFVHDSFTQKGHTKILDIGCATGELALNLARDFEMTGIDSSKAMIKIAGQKALPGNFCVCFKEMNMLKIAGEFPKEYFDTILCLGNTLVHLSDENSISGFFSSVYNCLKQGGKFIGQILNYDRFLQTEDLSLPLIKTKSLVFERFYTKRNDGRFDFHSLLTFEHKDEPYEATTPLFPLGKKNLQSLMEQAGFDKIRFFSNYKRSLWTSKDFLTIFESSKE